MKKIVITGSNGLLGQTLVNLLLKKREIYNIVGFSKGENRNLRTDFLYNDIDITDKVLLYDKLLEVQPSVIVNTAAMTNVDECESNQKECYLINYKAVEYLASFCREFRVHFIHISTDFIFDGKTGYYNEISKPNPLNYYGVSKLKAEKIVMRQVRNFTILRTILVYGQVDGDSQNNFVLWVKKNLEAGKKINVVTDQFRMPTYVEELAMACKMVIDQNAHGIFNVCSNILLSSYQIAQQIAVIFELDISLIYPTTYKVLNQCALRPPKTGFNLEKTNKRLGIFPKSFAEDLQKFKDKLSSNF